MRRRTFLAVGILGAATLTAAAWWAGARRSRAAPRALDADARTIVAAVVPVLLDGALPESSRERAVAETVDNVDRAVQGLPAAARAEIAQLFALLALTAGRRAFAGVASPWPEATHAEVEAFLQAWQASAWDLKRSAYDALHQLVFAAWYGNARAWKDIGYPGPPRIA